MSHLFQKEEEKGMQQQAFGVPWRRVSGQWNQMDNIIMCLGGSFHHAPFSPGCALHFASLSLLISPSPCSQWVDLNPPLPPTTPATPPSPTTCLSPHLPHTHTWRTPHTPPPPHTHTHPPHPLLCMVWCVW